MRNNRHLIVLAAGLLITAVAIGATALSVAGGRGPSTPSSAASTTGGSTTVTPTPDTPDTSADTTSNSVSPHPIAGNFKPSDTTLEECSAGPADRQTCLEQAFGNLAYREGAKVALARFAADIASDPEVERGCHRMAHMIGSASLARLKGDVGEAFAEGDSTCWSGYYHGILERALYAANSDVLVTRAVRQLCAKVKQTNPTFIYYQCVHGLGHGLMIQFGLDLPIALSYCDKLTDDWDRTSCDGGVFMENFNTSYGVRSRYLRDNEPLYPCTAVAEKHKLYCYLQITDRILELNGYDFAKAAQMCLAAESNWRGTCFQSYGRSSSGNSRNDQAEVIRLCGLVVDRYQSECVYGVVRDMVSNDSAAERATRYCAAVPKNSRPRCYSGLGTIVQGFDTTGEALREACAKVPAEFARYCLQQEAAPAPQRS